MLARSGNATEVLTIKKLIPIPILEAYALLKMLILPIVFFW